METRANYVIVGLFTVLALVSAFLFAYWQSNAGAQSEMVPVTFSIRGAASGLARGSLIQFNGVRVGSVQDVAIDTTNPAWAVATAMIDKKTPITKSTKAVVGIAGLTGSANIEMSGGNLSEPTIFLEAQTSGQTPVIPTSPSAVTDLLRTAQDILTRANNVVTDLEGFAHDSRQPLTQTAQNVQKFTDALAKNSDGIDKFLTSVSSVSDQLSGLSGKLDGTIQGVEQIVKAVDQQKIAAIVGNAETFSKNASEASKKFDSVVAKVDQLLGDTDTQNTVAQFGQTLESFRKTADTLNTRLGPIADDIASTLASYKQVATTLNSRLGPIADNLQRFSGQGLRDAMALINDARQQINRIGQAVSDLERNPQRIITGGDGEVRRYDGRARR